MDNNRMITVEVLVNASLETVWDFWNEPEHIKQWNNASEDWYTPLARNDLRPGGEYLYRMEAKDGSFGFDFRGVYDEVKDQEYISSTLGDGRKINVIFEKVGDQTRVIESFEPENEFSLEHQKNGWQSILDHFKRYVEQAKN